MDLRTLSLCAAPPPYLLVLDARRVLELRHPDGAPVLGEPDDKGERKPVFRAEVMGLAPDAVTAIVGAGGIVAHVAVPVVDDVDVIRSAGVKVGPDGKAIGQPTPSLMAVEAALRLVRHPATGKPLYEPADRATLRQAAVNVLCARICHAALTVYQVAQGAGNVSASPRSEATTPDGS